MPVVNVAFEINQTVFHVSMDSGVREGVVRSAMVEIDPTATVITYDIGYTLPTIGCGSSSTEADQDDLFADIDTALAEYKSRIETA